MKRMWIAILGLAILAAAALAQTNSVAPVAPSKSGMVSYIEGTVFVDDQLIPDPIVAQFPYMKENGLLRAAEGRAEVFMNPGLTTFLDANSTLRMISNRFIDTRVELVKGAAVVTLPEVTKDNSFTLVLKDATVAIAKAGVYHFYADPARVQVFAGSLRVQVGDQNLEVPAGKMVDLSGGTARLEKFDKTFTDALDRWSGRRGELMAAANASSARDCNSFVSSTRPCRGNWAWNPWYNLYTYIPYINRWCDPIWGYCYYNPTGVRDAYYRPQMVYTPVPPMMGGNPGYATSTPTSNGGSGAVAASSTAMSAPSAGTGSTAAPAAASSSIGRGSAATGGHGK